MLQTFSKSWGLAGIRCGVAIAQEDIVFTLNKMKAPYNLNKITSRIAVEALKNLDGLATNVAIVKSERERVMQELEVSIAAFARASVPTWPHGLWPVHNAR